MKKILLPLVLGAFLLPGLLFANTAPTVVIQSAAMRPGTTLMDVVFRVNDPDDATVKVRALAFVDGVRSFANIIKPVTFAEGTGNMIGDAITTNTDHTITWDAAADWNVQLGQAKFEILAMDGRGLLPLDWITIPAAGGQPAVTVSKNSPTDQEVLDALFWLYANGDSGLTIDNGILKGNASSGVFENVTLVAGARPQAYSTPFVFKRMNLDPDDLVTATKARAGIDSRFGWHAANRPYAGVNIVVGWGENQDGQVTIPSLAGVVAIAAGYKHSLALVSNGSVVGWGDNSSGQTAVPSGLTEVIAIAAGYSHSLALKNDGTVVAWGRNVEGQSTVPSGLKGVKAIATGKNHNLALKNDGTVVAWGNNYMGQTTVPNGLSGVTAIAAGGSHSLALKDDGTVVAWGDNSVGQTTIPVEDVVFLAITGHGNPYFVSDFFYSGSFMWESGTKSGHLYGTRAEILAYLDHFDLTYDPSRLPNSNDIPLLPINGVIAIAAGDTCSLALRSADSNWDLRKRDGRVEGWGETTIPNSSDSVTWSYVGYDGRYYGNSYTTYYPLNGIKAISAGHSHCLALKTDGTLVSWGDNRASQATIPSGLTGITAISAGGLHSLAIKAKAQ
jgi:alpha-tubulin suppressor-like RCC1 family protein